jgi:hypothetical protein
MQSIRRSFVLVLSLSLLLFFSLCTISKASENEPAKTTFSSTLVEGSWLVYGVAKITFTHKNKHLTKVIGTSETWTFNSDHSFTASDTTSGDTVVGSWSEKGKNVVVYFNKVQYQNLIDAALEAVGVPANVIITRLTATGTVGASIVKGKITVKAVVYLIDYGVNATMTATASFVGGRTALEDIENADPESESLPEAISGLVVESISLP